LEGETLKSLLACIGGSPEGAALSSNSIAPEKEGKSTILLNFVCSTQYGPGVRSPNTCIRETLSSTPPWFEKADLFVRTPGSSRHSAYQTDCKRLTPTRDPAAQRSDQSEHISPSGATPPPDLNPRKLHQTPEQRFSLLELSLSSSEDSWQLIVSGRGTPMRKQTVTPHQGLKGDTYEKTNSDSSSGLEGLEQGIERGRPVIPLGPLQNVKIVSSSKLISKKAVRNQ
jgi:hypothetical protein